MEEKRREEKEKRNKKENTVLFIVWLKKTLKNITKKINN